MTTSQSLPGGQVNGTKAPGHWLLARLGKRVLRPGGLQLTRCMLASLRIKPDDDVIEFGPGLGATARLALSKKPHSYVAIERDENAAAIADRYVQGPNRSCCIVSADQTGLATGAASVVYGEAMLTMQGKRQKRAIVAEAARLLRTGGRYAIHEICFVPDELPQETRDVIEHDLAKTIRVATQPLTIVEWREVLTEQGFKITGCFTAPMHLLEFYRLMQDEGLWRVLLIISRLLRDADARSRVLAMKKVFRRHWSHLRAIMLVGQKAPGCS